MSTTSPDPADRGGPEDPAGGRDFDAEFSRILGHEGLPPSEQPGLARPEPDRPDPARPSRPGGDVVEPRPDADGPEDDEVLLGDFEPPDPDLPPSSDAMVWSWSALVGGVLLVLLAAVLASIPTWLGAIGGLAAVGGLVSLLVRIPTDRSGPSDGAQV